MSIPIQAYPLIVDLFHLGQIRLPILGELEIIGMTWLPSSDLAIFLSIIAPLGEGTSMVEVCKHLVVLEQTYYGCVSIKAG
jgi:hypothetical protein